MSRKVAWLPVHISMDWIVLFVSNSPLLIKLFTNWSAGRGSIWVWRGPRCSSSWGSFRCAEFLLISYPHILLKILLFQPECFVCFRRYFFHWERSGSSRKLFKEVWITIALTKLVMLKGWENVHLIYLYFLIHLHKSRTNMIIFMK